MEESENQAEKEQQGGKANKNSNEPFLSQEIREKYKDENKLTDKSREFSQSFSPATHLHMIAVNSKTPNYTFTLDDRYDISS